MQLAYLRIRLRIDEGLRTFMQTWFKGYVGLLTVEYGCLLCAQAPCKIAIDACRNQECSHWPLYALTASSDARRVAQYCVGMAYSTLQSILQAVIFLYMLVQQYSKAVLGTCRFAGEVYVYIKSKPVWVGLRVRKVFDFGVTNTGLTLQQNAQKNKTHTPSVSLPIAMRL